MRSIPIRAGAKPEGGRENIPKNQDKMFDIGCDKFKMISFVKIFSRKGAKVRN